MKTKEKQGYVKTELEVSVIINWFIRMLKKKNWKNIINEKSDGFKDVEKVGDF